MRGIASHESELRVKGQNGQRKYLHVSLVLRVGHRAVGKNLAVLKNRHFVRRHRRRGDERCRMDLGATVDVDVANYRTSTLASVVVSKGVTAKLG